MGAGRGAGVITNNRHHRHNGRSHMTSSDTHSVDQLEENVSYVGYSVMAENRHFHAICGVLAHIAAGVRRLSSSHCDPHECYEAECRIVADRQHLARATRREPGLTRSAATTPCSGSRVLPRRDLIRVGVAHVFFTRDQNSRFRSSLAATNAPKRRGEARGRKALTPSPCPAARRSIQRIKESRWA